ncbi:ribosomal L1 domain-containing protein CG13096-like [Mercenaria mercenaria]|uniref:ribosomal L1 domain-containing protein CG13096-like n=1 Tax=Mercenaria mercenaria TaxID=6596 RepID=UPI00234E4823|nr:ribosomal L1 domain-containing protein CG13096-like [Mercenaria mercenaria]
MLEKKRVEGAVDAVLTLLKTKDDSVSLVDQPKKIDLQFTLKQIPKLKHKNIQIDLPTSIHYELREVCVFVKDLDKKNREYEATVQHYEDLFRQHKIENITKIVPIKALRTDYSLPSSKISLAKAYDLYLADSCVMGLLPGILGKIFYAKKKTIPVKVNLGAKNLKNEIDRAVSNTRCTIQGSGSSCLVTVAHDKMKKKEMVANILAASKHLADQVPGGLENIRNMYIKSSDTTAVPVYLDIDSANEIKLPKVKTNKVATYIDEITTIEHGQVMVQADGHVKIIKDEENETDRKESPKVMKKGRKGKKADAKKSEEETDEVVTEIKEEIDDSAEFGISAGEGDDKNDVVNVDSDDDSKDDVKAEISKSKKSGKSGKKQKKRKSGGDNEEMTVEKKKQKWTEVATTKQTKKLNKKGKKARKA